MRTLKVVHLILAFLAAGTMPVAVVAQSDSANQNATELRKQLDEALRSKHRQTTRFPRHEHKKRHCRPGQKPGQGKAALVPEPDVDEDEVRPQRAGLPERLGDARCRAHDRQALPLKEKARRLEEGIVVIN